MNQPELLSLLEQLQIKTVRAEHLPLKKIEDYYKHDIELPDQGIKNLFLRDRKGRRFYLLVMDEHKQADLAKIAEQVQENRLAFASEDNLQKYLGVDVGCVTPFGLVHDTEKTVQVLLDAEIKKDELLGFHPMVNDATECITYDDFLRFLKHTGHDPKEIKV